MCRKVYRHKESAFWNAQLTDNALQPTNIPSVVVKVVTQI